MPRDLDELMQRVKERGFTPSLRDLDGLIGLLGSPDRELGRNVVSALGRLGRPALAVLQGRFEEAKPPARARLCDAIATIGDDDVADWLLQRLDDADGPTRRRAAVRLGKLRSPAVAAKAAPALAAAMDRSVDSADQRAFAEALGNLGGGSALDVLARAAPLVMHDALSVKRLATARVRIKQRTLRQEASTIALDHALAGPTPLLLHVRAGLEPLLLTELANVPGAGSARTVGRGRVRVTWNAHLAPLFRARTFLHLGFPLAVDPHLPPADAVVQAMTLPSTTSLLRALTTGPVRYRLDWAADGARRSDTNAVATAIESAVPWLVNDPAQAPWEVIVTTFRDGGPTRTFIELWPKRLADPRFTYRQATMPASSHPTIAAALAHVAGARAHDVVWDPFVGTGMELVERARMGPYALLYGTDVDARAIEAARTNTQAAGIEATLVQQDARAFAPSRRINLLITNPPFGQRVPVAGGVEALLEQVLDHAVSVLGPHGRIAFITPRERATSRVLSRHGLTRLHHYEIDVGGFYAHLESWQRQR